MNENPFPFSHYLRLYTLHQVEQPGHLLLLRIQIETVRYCLLPLPTPVIDAAYAEDPRQGVALAREVVQPRLEALLGCDDPLAELGLGTDREALWRRYAAARGLPVTPAPVPSLATIPVTPRLPPRSRMSARLAQAQRALEVVHMAVDTASTLAALWQNWQMRREQVRLLAAQRRLLEAAVATQRAGQERALQQALDGEFVRGYLADHAGDAAYPALFGDAPAPAG